MMRKRLEKFGQDPGGEYASISQIHREIEYAESLYKQNKRQEISRKNQMTTIKWFFRFLILKMKEF